MPRIFGRSDIRGPAFSCGFLDGPCRGCACLFCTPTAEGGSSCVAIHCFAGFAALGAVSSLSNAPAESLSVPARLLLSAPAQWSAAALASMDGGSAGALARAASIFPPALDARRDRDPRRSLHRLARLLARLGPEAVEASGMPRRMAAYVFWEFWDFQFLESEAAANFLAACRSEELAALASILDDAGYAALLAAATPETAEIMETAREAIFDFPLGVLVQAGDALERAALLCEEGRLTLPLPGFPGVFEELEPLPETALPSGVEDCAAECCPLLDAACLRERCALWEEARDICGVIVWREALFVNGGRECPGVVREVLAASLGGGGEQAFRMLAPPVKARIWADFALESLDFDEDGGEGGADALSRHRVPSALLADMGRGDRARLKAAALAERPGLAGQSLAAFTASVESLSELADEEFRELLKETSIEELVLCLVNAGDDLREKCRLNLSERAFKMIREDVESMKRVRLDDVEDARRRLLHTAFRLAREGIVRLPEGFGE